MLRFTLVAAGLLAAQAQLPLCQVDSSPTCATTSVCGYVPAAYAGPNNTAVCAPVSPITANCAPGIEVIQQTYNSPIVSAILNVWVCDGNNNKVAIGGLSSSAFNVQEDGAPMSNEAMVNIVSGDLPKLRTLVLVDVSYSMTGNSLFSLQSYLSTVNSTVTSLFNILATRANANPPIMRSHWIALGVFSGGAHQRVCNYFNLQDTTALLSLQACLGKLDIIFADDSSNVYDTIVQAVSAINSASQMDPEYAAANPLYFNTVLLISDGVDSANVGTFGSAIAANTQVAAIGTGTSLNTTTFGMLLPAAFTVPTFIPGASSGTVNPLATSAATAQAIFEAKTLVRGQYTHSGHYFIRYCTASRGNGRAGANNMHSLTISLADPAFGSSRPLVGSTSATVQFQAQPSSGPCRDRVSYISATAVPGKMSTVYGGTRQFACAFVGQTGVVDKFYCPTPIPTIAPVVPAPSASITPTPTSTYRPVTILTVGVQPDLDGHSVGTGIGIALAIFFAIMGSALIYIGVRYWRTGGHEGLSVGLPKASNVVVSQNPLSIHEPRASMTAFAPASVPA